MMVRTSGREVGLKGAILLAALMFLVRAEAQDFTPEQLAKRTVERRAVDAVIWGMPLVNTGAMRQAYFRDVRAKYNDICFFSKPADWRFQPRPTTSISIST